MLISWLSNHAYSNLRMFQYLSGLSDQLSQRWRSEKYWHRKSMIFNLPHTPFTYCQITSLLCSCLPPRGSLSSLYLQARLLHRLHILKPDSPGANVGSPWETTPEMCDQTQPQGISQATRNMILLFHSPAEKFSRRQLWRSCRMASPLEEKGKRWHYRVHLSSLLMVYSGSRD